MRALDDFRRAGVHFVSITEAIDTGTAVGKMAYTLLACVAEFERALIAEPGTELVTVDEMADRLAMTRKTFTHLVREAGIPPAPPGHHSWVRRSGRT